ncbi:hepatic leukemia factor-like [Gadus macrocephalus]|uniref:hepatic leukemia factor-like n=1 Tax=Gadus macrocephalus TaxID=80720 RepID=UPI0028CBA17F|nr:hepatic leukemia factor-like [Gadus macrocephalus]
MEKMARQLSPSNGVLKSLLENPLKLPFQHDGGLCKDKEKEKKLEDEGGAGPQSAFLGPTLWDKTLPYDGDNFQLEYMDLEEFLSENGIPASSAQHAEQQGGPGATPGPQRPPSSPSPSPSSSSSPSVRATIPSLPGRPRPQEHMQKSSIADLAPSRDTPSPIDPESIRVPVGYNPDPADLALSSVPGQEVFDPRKRKFSAEELKPQPMIKKARKIFIPEDLKDDRYWARRRKNNVAAKRSRDARRLKENQIAIRASFLEKENGALRREVADLRKELGRCTSVVAQYQDRHGPL